LLAVRLGPWQQPSPSVTSVGSKKKMQGCVTLVFIFSPAAVTSSPAAVTSRCARDQLGRGFGRHRGREPGRSQRGREPGRSKRGREAASCWRAGLRSAAIRRAVLGRQPQVRARLRARLLGRQPRVRARLRARLLGRQPRVRARPPVASPFVQVRRAISPVLPFFLANLGDGVRLLLVRGGPSAVAAVGEVGLILDGA
jgi:hypothetical protein